MVNDILKQDSGYYKWALRNNCRKEYNEYLASRGLSDDTVKLFGVGCSFSHKGVVKSLIDREYTLEEITNYGIGCNGEFGVFDKMHHRLTLELRDFRGSLIGFAGRSIVPNPEVKYLNTGATPIFTKGNNVFNLDKAKYAIDYTDNNYLILVEGYFDVMSLYDKGVKNVVAAMGTALTVRQALLLKLFTDRGSGVLGRGYGGHYGWE